MSTTMTEAAPPVVGPHGYELSDDECRRLAKGAVEAFRELEGIPNDECVRADIAYANLDDAFPWEFWHCDAEGELQGTARELAEREKRDEQSQGVT